MLTGILKIAQLPSGQYQNIVNMVELVPSVAGALGVYQFGGTLSSSELNNANESLPLIERGSPTVNTFGASLDKNNCFDSQIVEASAMTFMTVCKIDGLPSVLIGTYSASPPIGSQLYQASIAGAPVLITGSTNGGGSLTDATRWLAPGVSSNWSISGTTLTVTSNVSAGFAAGQTLKTTKSGFVAGTSIVSQLSGTPGGNGTYEVSVSQTVSDAGSNYLRGGEPNSDDWVFIAARFQDATNVKTTIINNGASIQSESGSVMSGRSVSTRNVLIGGHYSGDEFTSVNSQLFCAIYDRYLSDSEVAQVYSEIKEFYLSGGISV